MGFSLGPAKCCFIQLNQLHLFHHMTVQKLCWHREGEAANHQVRHLLATVALHADLHRILNHNQRAKLGKTKFKFAQMKWEMSTVVTTWEACIIFKWNIFPMCYCLSHDNPRQIKPLGRLILTYWSRLTDQLLDMKTSPELRVSGTVKQNVNIYTWCVA